MISLRPDRQINTALTLGSAPVHRFIGADSFDTPTGTLRPGINTFQRVGDTSSAVVIMKSGSTAYPSPVFGLPFGVGFGLAPNLLTYDNSKDGIGNAGCRGNDPAAMADRSANVAAFDIIQGIVPNRGGSFIPSGFASCRSCAK